MSQVCCSSCRVSSRYAAHTHEIPVCLRNMQLHLNMLPSQVSC